MSKLDVSDLASGNCHSLPKSFIPKDLKTCDKVWLRIDRIRKPLEAPYSGPYKVIKRMTKHFQIQLSDDAYSCVSIDRLKPVVEPDELCNSSDTDPVQNSQMDSDLSDCDTRITDDPSSVNPELEDIVSPQVKTSSSGRKIRFKNSDDFYYY